MPKKAKKAKRRRGAWDERFMTEVEMRELARFIGGYLRGKPARKKKRI